MFVAEYANDKKRTTENLVDKLLASPQFGERWGRHWLDVARYGESNGNDGLSRNPTFPHAWRYRDYVIQSFNDDVPYDRFITEQIAGDLLPAKTAAQKDRLLIATGFLALGSKPAKAMNNNFDMDIVNDQIDVVCRGVLGLSVACARCHDHKHDPIPTYDYYALAGVFKSTETMWGVAANEKLTAPPTPLHQLKSYSKINLPKQITKKLSTKKSEVIQQEKKPVSKKKKQPAVKKKKKPAPKTSYPPGTPLAMGVRDRKKPEHCKINIKGESKKLGPVATRGFLEACGSDRENYPIAAKQSGRLQLAQWLMSSQNPQAARVIVNRIWLHLFGQAIVGTPDDFGVYGDRPTHPELLDHLATEMIRQKWSIKKMIRKIVLSRTYQLSSQGNQQANQIDPDNKWLCRHKRRRLDAESLRDGILLVSGQLNLKPGQGSVIQHMDILVNEAGSLHQPSNHRSIYLCMLRNSPPPELAAFDFPEGGKITGQRNMTTLPSQALFLLNSPFLVTQSQHFANVIFNSKQKTDAARITMAYNRALARNPQRKEIKRAKQYLQTMNTELSRSNPDKKIRMQKVWASFCQALLASNEFRYVE